VTTRARCLALALAFVPLACTARPLDTDDAADDVGTTTDPSGDGTSDTSSTTESTSTDTSTSTESTSTDTSTTDTGPECRVWDDCPFEDCINYQCIDGVCVGEPFDCSLPNTPCHVPACFPGLESSCGIDFCDVYDGLVDARIEVAASGYVAPSALDVGGELELFGYENCNVMQIVRDRSSDEPLLIYSLGYAPELLDDVWMSRFGESWAALVAPLSVQVVDAGQCAVADCQARGSIDVALADEPPARVLDSLLGAGPAGFILNNGFAHFGQCLEPYEAARFALLRSDCGDCPAPTFHDTCVEEVEPALDGFTVEFLIEGEFVANPASHWRFECVVLAAEEVVDAQGQTIQRRDLDCASISQSFSSPFCT
jgi:hypothetical protein